MDLNYLYLNKPNYSETAFQLQKHRCQFTLAAAA